MNLINDDCLNAMKDIPEASIDLIVCDLPYGTTSCKWDVVIPFEELWKEYKRISKTTTPIILFGVQPFTSTMILSNIKMFKYTLVWEKERPTNIFFIKKQIGRVHEDIVVFYKNQPTYNPIMEARVESTIGVGNLKKSKTHKNQNYKYSSSYDKNVRYPRSVIKINRDTLKGSLHPTQKPVALIEYLILSFSNENDTVLDNCMGSGTTGVACKKLNRNFIGIEKDKKYFDVACNRINQEKG